MEAGASAFSNPVVPSGQPQRSSLPAISGNSVHQEEQEYIVDLRGSREHAKLCPSGSWRDFAMFTPPPITTAVADHVGRRPCPTHQLGVRLRGNDVGTDTMTRAHHPTQRNLNSTA